MPFFLRPQCPDIPAKLRSVCSTLAKRCIMLATWSALSYPFSYMFCVLYHQTCVLPTSMLRSFSKQSGKEWVTAVDMPKTYRALALHFWGLTAKPFLCSQDKGLPLSRKTVSRVSGGVLCKQLPPEFKHSVMVCDAPCSEGSRAALWHAAVNSDQYLCVFWRWNSNHVVNKRSLTWRVVLSLRLKPGNWGIDSGFSWLYILHHLPTSEMEL